MEANRSASLDSLDSYFSSYIPLQLSQTWNYQGQSAITIPTQFVWNPGTGTSVSLYLEKQFREKEINLDQYYGSGVIDDSGTSITNFDETYLSLTYRNSKPSIPYSVTLFYDN